jgi:TPP-dependent trihydroxycyclohexane-1,2-dione (THcHDO) dehydratase
MDTIRMTTRRRCQVFNNQYFECVGEQCKFVKGVFASSGKERAGAGAGARGDPGGLIR